MCERDIIHQIRWTTEFEVAINYKMHDLDQCDVGGYQSINKQPQGFSLQVLKTQAIDSHIEWKF